MRSEKLKRFCAVLLSVLILFTMMPSLALADDPVMYAITVDTGISYGGTVNVQAEAAEGEPVTFTLMPDEGYTYKKEKVTVTGNDGEVSVTGEGPEFTFEMPASAVTITAEFVRESTIEVKTAEHGNVQADKEKACTGDPVTFTAVPEEGYERVSVTVSSGEGDVLVTDEGSDTFSFEMPASAVTITAAFTPIESDVVVETAEHGSIESNKETACTGDTVTLTVKPDNYYKLKSLHYVVEGKAPVEITDHPSDNTYTFTMPGAKVTVVPEFEDIIYTISADPDMKNGSVTFTDDSGNPVIGAKYFGRVNVNVDPDSGYLLETIHAEGGGRRYDDIFSESSGRYYISAMPAVDLTVYATFKTHTHALVHTAAASPSCETSGNVEYWHCEECSSYFTDAEATNKIRRADLILPAIGHSWGAWTVTKQPTATKAGEKKRVCKHDSSHIETEKIPATGKKETPTPTPEKKKPEKSTKKEVLVAKAKTGTNQVTLSWNKIKDADRYVIMFSKCNYNEKSYKVKKIKTVKANVLKYTVKKLENGRCYKYKIIAQKKKKGNYKNLAKTFLSHTIIGNESSHEAVPKSLKLNKKAVTLTAGKTVKLKGKIKLYNSEREIMSHAPALRFATSDPGVATVSTTGKITAKKKGTCTVYAQTINGICQKCKVTVN